MVFELGSLTGKCSCPESYVLMMKRSYKLLYLLPTTIKVNFLHSPLCLSSRLSALKVAQQHHNVGSNHGAARQKQPQKA